MKNALKDLHIRKAKASERTKTLRDGEGLFLVIKPTGDKRWVYRFTLNGKERKNGLGSYPRVSLDLARERRDDKQKLVANGIDPVAHKRATKSVPKIVSVDPSATFEFVAREWFKKNMSDLVPSHRDRVLRRFERDVFPWLGERPIKEIESGELLAVLERIEERNAFETARRTLQTSNHIFRYAVLKKKTNSNIAADLRGALTKPKRKEQQHHHAAVVEPSKICDLLLAIDGYGGAFVTRCALALSPLFFVRPGELRHAKWTDIDLNAAEWRFMSSKTNQPHVVPLATQAIKILRELHPLTGDGKYVFPGARSQQRPMSENAILAALRSLGYTKDEMTGHGFRAMARTVLDEVLGERVDLIEHQLAHAVKDANGRAYNRTSFLPQRHTMMQTWADYLDTLRKEKPRPAKAAA